VAFDFALDFLSNMRHKACDGREFNPNADPLMTFFPFCETVRNERRVSDGAAAGLGGSARRFLPGFFAAAIALCCGWPVASAQEAPQPADPVSLEKAVEKLARLDADFANNLEETRAAMEAEAAAKRITDNVAQSLRW
jgi:hypothetical protein